MTQIGRNDPCKCGSGKKYKKCCGAPGLGKRAQVISTSGASSLLGRISQAGESLRQAKGEEMEKNLNVTAINKRPTGTLDKISEPSKEKD